jgi:acyl-coenzyme A thioesterase PaaI-like protein
VPEEAANKLKELLEGVPFNAYIGIQLVRTEPGRSKCKLPFRDELTNHVGSLHAAAQYSLIEAASGAVLMSSFPELLDAATPLALGAEIAYRAPAHGDCIAEATLDHEDIEEAKLQLASARKARVDVRVNLADANGTISTEATIHWYIRMNVKK